MSEPLINDLIKENADYTIRDYLDLVAELHMIGKASDKIIDRRLNEIAKELENFENE